MGSKEAIKELVYELGKKGVIDDSIERIVLAKLEK